MKITRCFLPCLILTAFGLPAAEPEFPGLKAIMSEADWQKAKLDRLDAADIQLINEAFARFLKPQPKPPEAPAAMSEEAPASAKKRSLWDRFGLPVATVKEPAEQIVMHAKVLAWKGTNGFVLDNNQVWEGLDPIRDELVGREIGIARGRFGSFLLEVDGKTTSVRLRRLK